MNDVLNRHTSIDQLYQSVLEYADGKKGIVYAVSIDHARNIAAYYSGKGLDAAAIDSHTPTAERGRMVEDFKTGRIKVLVNVDVFSEDLTAPMWSSCRWHARHSHWPNICNRPGAD